jgi:small subunit ribosomal protein S8
MMTDPIADMLTRIRNAVRIEHAHVIWGWTEVDNEPLKKLRIELKYGPNGERVIRHIRRVSKPGRRVYSRAVDLRPVLQGLGITVLSTSRGVISDREARQRNLGGEVLCEVW